LSENEEEEQDMEEGAVEFEMDFEVPVVLVAESGGYVYVCSECGSDLTEIPYYNRYYCESCGLHY
jgi:predicted amidophosphoribosyltransferase